MRPISALAYDAGHEQRKKTVIRRPPLHELYQALNDRFWDGQLPRAVMARDYSALVKRARANEKAWAVWRALPAPAESPDTVVLRNRPGGIVVRRVNPIWGQLRLRGSKKDYAGTFHGTRWGYPARILVAVAPAVIRRDDMFFTLDVLQEERRALLHEMAHAAVYFSGEEAKEHGLRFIAELERLAALGEAWAADEAMRYRHDLAREQDTSEERSR